MFSMYQISNNPCERNGVLFKCENGSAYPLKCVTKRQQWHSQECNWSWQKFVVISVIGIKFITYTFSLPLKMSSRYLWTHPVEIQGNWCNRRPLNAIELLGKSIALKQSFEWYLFTRQEKNKKIIIKKNCRKRENAERIMDDKADDEEQNGETFSYNHNFVLCLYLEGTYILQCLYIHGKYIKKAIP